MGGTSFDVALVARRPARHHDRRLDRRPPDRIADPRYPHDRCGRRLDRAGRVRGLLAVGPASAGAQPGPACYGRGGTQPTVTDADFVLGYLDPAGVPRWSAQARRRDAAKRAIEEHVAKPLGIDVTRAADGIYQVINANMAVALGVVSVQRGYDPRASSC